MEKSLETLEDRKAALRRRMLAARQPATAACGEALGAHVLRQWPPSSESLIGGFWPIGSEMDVRPLLLALHGRGHRLALPITPPRGQPLRFLAWRPGDPLVPGPMGLQEPSEGAEVAPNWLLVPLVAFDTLGGRLGYGGGYFDRTMAALPGATFVGVAHAMQQVAQVPMGPYDMRLHAIATEAGVTIV